MRADGRLRAHPKRPPAWGHENPKGSPIVAGDHVSIPLSPESRGSMRSVVQALHGGAGHWACVDHFEHLPGTRNHRGHNLVWVCDEHGPEA